MIIDDLHIVSIVVLPAKTDPVLIVDPNAALTRSVTFQEFKTISRERRQIEISFGGRYSRKLDPSLNMQIDRQAIPGPFRIHAVANILRRSVGKTYDRHLLYYYTTMRYLNQQI
jgi:hypothetical protein